MQGLDFSGRQILVTGASSGIGYAVAAGFARAKGEVAILSLDSGVHAAAERLGAIAGRPVRAFQCDIADRAQVERAIGSLSRIDVLVNNAGLEAVTPIDEPGRAVEDAFRRVFDVNVMGSYFVTREALPRMADGSRIVFTASTWAKYSIPRMSAYCASKHAVLGLVRSLAHELGGRRITVNAICPGWVRTDQSFRSVKVITEVSGRSIEQLTDDLLRVQAMPGLLEPDNVVGSYLFLASDLAKDITGQSLHVDRGEFMS